MKARPITDVVTQEYAEEHPWDEVKRTPEGRNKPGRIVVPDEAQVDEVLKRMSGASERLCGFCRHFDLQLGQTEFKQNQKAFEMAFNELEHSPDWYGSTDHMGACHQWEGHSPHAMAPAKIPNQFLDSSVDYHHQDQAVDCPYFQARKAGSRSGGRHYTFSRSHRKW